MKKDHTGKENYRIADIATLAGVSVGTVDRVLHKRGRVSVEALKRVEKIMEDLNYQPNPSSRLYTALEPCRIVALIPAFKPGEYWARVYEGMRRARHEFAGSRIEIQLLPFDQYDEDSLDAIFQEVTKSDNQGAIIATLFKKSVLQLTKWFDKQMIPYVLIDAYMEHTNCIACYGTDSYRSGYIAGRLLLDQIKIDDDLMIFNIIHKNQVGSAQVSLREKGFRDFLLEAKYRGRIFPIPIATKALKKNEQLLDRIMRNNTAKAGIVFNSRVNIVASYFFQRNINDFFLIGYDATEANIPFLKNGIVSHLIAQRPEEQGYNSVRALFLHILRNQPVEKINFMPIDILIKENIDYYHV